MMKGKVVGEIREASSHKRPQTRTSSCSGNPLVCRQTCQSSSCFYCLATECTFTMVSDKESFFGLSSLLAKA